MFLVLPITTASVLVFSALIGLLWLSTVPLTSGLVALMFGTRHIGMLFGVVFLSHQIGAFLGALLGGTIYESTGSYDTMWVLCILLSVFAAIVHLPIREQQGDGGRRPRRGMTRRRASRGPHRARPGGRLVPRRALPGERGRSGQGRGRRGAAGSSARCIDPIQRYGYTWRSC